MPLRTDVTEKFWKNVINALDDIENVQSYYAGGTLCIDLKDGVSYCLNLDGKGFILNRQSPFSLTVYQPEIVLNRVKKIYVDIKGITEHFASLHMEN